MPQNYPQNRQNPNRKDESIRRANRVIQSRTFVLMLIIIAGLLIMHKPYALLLGMLIGVADVLPVIGAGLFLNTWAIGALIIGDRRQTAGPVPAGYDDVHVRRFSDHGHTGTDRRPPGGQHLQGNAGRGRGQAGAGHPKKRAALEPPVG